jgi:hypothetical protein
MSIMPTAGDEGTSSWHEQRNCPEQEQAMTLSRFPPRSANGIERLRFRQETIGHQVSSAQCCVHSFLRFQGYSYAAIETAST